MLKNIIFIIDDPKERAAAGRAGAVLERDGLRAVLTQRRALSGAWTSLLQGKKDGFEDTLFVTDNPQEADTIRRAGGYVAALFTEANRQDSFPDIPYALETIEEVEASYYRRLYERCAGIPWIILRTKRCTVREITLEDVDDLYRIYAEPSITAYMEGLFEDRKEELEYTAHYIRNIYGFYGYGMWIIEKNDTGEVIGRAGVEYKTDMGGLELGYMIARPFQRQGYAEEVCRAVLDYARRELGFSDIYSLVKPGNTASECLCRKLGMERAESSGRLRQDYLVYRMKKNDAGTE